MAGCWMCDRVTGVGALCASHARALATCRDITAEQIMAPEVEAPQAWLIDQWGRPHPLAGPAAIGRAPERADVAVLHPSVSALHAQLEVEAGRWRISDQGSLNGTCVNGRRVRVAPLGEGDRLQVGDVTLYFSQRGRPGDGAARAIAGGTLPTPSRSIAFAATLGRAGGTIELQQRAGGGIVRAGDTTVELARLEFALLQNLVETLETRGEPELAFLSSRELAASLQFQSREADSDNVRELVRRVRKKLAAAGVDDLIESRQGVGYRIGWTLG
jgi:hypothetical protein